MAKYRSEDEAPIVENPAVGDNEEVIVAAAGTEPDMPPTTPIDPIAEVDSTRSPEADPTVPEQRFRSEGENVEAAPAAPIDGAVPAAEPVAPEVDAAPMAEPQPEAEVTPAAPIDGAVPAAEPVAPEVDAAPMAEPQPEVEVAPAAPVEGEVPAAEPVAPEVAAAPEVGAVEPAAAAPAEAPLDNAPIEQRFKQEDGEVISVVETPDPEVPGETEAVECPESGEVCVDKDIKEQINPVISQEDEVVADEPANDDGNQAGNTEPLPMETHEDETMLEPEEAETQEAAEAEIDAVTQCMRMEGETEGGDVSEGDGDGGESGDQSVKVNVAVEGPNTDAHEGEDAAPLIAESAPKACGKGMFKSEDESNLPQIEETVADVKTSDIDESEDPVDVVPTPDPDQMFNSFMSEGGGFL